MAYWHDGNRLGTPLRQPDRRAGTPGPGAATFPQSPVPLDRAGAAPTVPAPTLSKGVTDDRAWE